MLPPSQGRIALRGPGRSPIPSLRFAVAHSGTSFSLQMEDDGRFRAQATAALQLGQDLRLLVHIGISSGCFSRVQDERLSLSS